jgi:pimeloyl-ACP methyl ester carboxylesterase
MAAESMAENLRAGDAYEWGHEAAFAYAPDFVPNLSKTEHALLVMNPQDDTCEQTRRIDPYLKNGRRVDYPDWGHGFLNAYPEAVARDMLDFFAEAERR